MKMAKKRELTFIIKFLDKIVIMKSLGEFLRLIFWKVYMNEKIDS